MTYPNVMILKYLKDSKKSAPGIEMKAEGLINAGYQRLLTFEVGGGGFSWFGKRPAHPLLTAYGLMEFRDMSAVFPVDERIIERTQSWLSGRQNLDGSFPLDSREMHSGPMSGGRMVLNTAYITWALLESGYRGSTADRAVEYLKKHMDETDDPYTLALITNALGLHSPDSADTRRAVIKLIAMANIFEDRASFRGTLTATYGCGESGDVEATALAAQAILRFSDDAGILQKALNFLVSTRQSSGTWGSTQASVLALRVLVESQKKPQTRSGQIEVRINGKLHSTFALTPENSDVLQMADLRDAVRSGNNEIDLVKKGGGALTYQVASKYYMPWKKSGEEKEPELGIKVNYDRTTLSTDDILNAEAILKHNSEGTTSMVIADLGIPPGFTVLNGDFDKLKARGVISRYEMTPRKVIVYLMGLSSPVRLPYRLKARFPIKARTPQSKVYEYYNPGNHSLDKPQDLMVNKGRPVGSPPPSVRTSSF